MGTTQHCRQPWKLYQPVHLIILNQSNFSDPGPTFSSEMPVAPPTELSTPTASHDLSEAVGIDSGNIVSLLNTTATVPFVGTMSIELTECLLELDCQRSCCTHTKPYRPTQEEIKRTSTRKQTTKERSSNVRTCPSSILFKYAWVTYCSIKGTITCYFCKRAMRQDLITFSLSPPQRL